jgi:sialate O-acetylesterase
MRNYLKLLSFLLMVLFGLADSSVSAKILLPQILSSNMVLQRDKPISIWGFANPGEKVSVSFAKQTKTTVANSAGNWEVILKPLKTSSKPQSMFIIGSNQIELKDILVGEVWLCSGQSNMEYAMRKLVKIPKPLNQKLGFPQNEVVKATNSNVRIFLVNRKTLSKPDSIHNSWSIAQDSALRAFSVVGYFYAKELQEKLGIPIGIIESAVSGSAIEPWIAKSALEEEPYFNNQKISNDPGKFFTPMIEPLAKFKIRGFLWYQGETNCFLNENISYAYKMKTLISLWRKIWKEETAPFYYVQIAPYNYSKHSGKIPLNENTQPEFWEAQAQLLRLPNTGMVVTTDLNDDGEDLHPTYKWEVGRRLSLWALAKTYGKKIEYTGPLILGQSDRDSTIIIQFNKASTLKNQNGDGVLMGFEIAGADGKFYPAHAKIIANTVMLKSPSVPRPVEARYNWSESPKGTLYSKTGLPALPFRTSNPLTAQFKTN